jgi:hypothetical protein
LRTAYFQASGLAWMSMDGGQRPVCACFSSRSRLGPKLPLCASDIFTPPIANRRACTRTSPSVDPRSPDRSGGMSTGSSASRVEHAHQPPPPLLQQQHFDPEGVQIDPVQLERPTPNTPLERPRRTYIHAVRYRPHTALACLYMDLFMHPHRMDDRGTCWGCRCACGQPRVFQHNRQEHGTRQLPSVAGRWLLALLASDLGLSVGAPPTADPLIRWSSRVAPGSRERTQMPPS